MERRGYIVNSTSPLAVNGVLADLNFLIPLAVDIEGTFHPFANMTLRDLGSFLLNDFAITDNTTVSEISDLLNSILAGASPASTMLVSNATTSAFGNVLKIRSYLESAMLQMVYGDKRPMMRKFEYVFLVLTGMVVLLRCWSRWVFMHKLLWSDGVISMSYLLIVLFTVMCFIGQNAGGGQHVWDVKYANIVFNAKMSFVAEQIYSTSMACVKASLLMFYYGLSPERNFRRCVLALATITFLHYCAGRIGIILQCFPLEYWNHPLTVKCFNRLAFLLADGIINTVLDFLILALPLYIVFTIQLNGREKLIVGTLFSLGSTVCIVSGYRLRSMRGLADGLDSTWYEADAAFYCLLEVHLAIISASVPAVKALFMKYYHACRVLRPSSSSSSLSHSEKLDLKLNGMDYADKAPPNGSVVIEMTSTVDIVTVMGSSIGSGWSGKDDFDVVENWSQVSTSTPDAVETVRIVRS